MNEKVLVIKEIERLMAPILSNDQLGKLHSVLDHCLLDADDFPLRNTQFSTNGETIDAFLSAKSVEGCSIRTIRYYSQALERFSRAIQCIYWLQRVNAEHFYDEVQESSCFSAPARSPARIRLLRRRGRQIEV